jgi:hypothetical protein
MVEAQTPQEGSKSERQMSKETQKGKMKKGILFRALIFVFP